MKTEEDKAIGITGSSWLISRGISSIVEMK